MFMLHPPSFQICVIPKKDDGFWIMCFIVGEWDDTGGYLQLVVTSPWLKTAPPNRHPAGDMGVSQICWCPTIWDLIGAKSPIGS